MSDRSNRIMAATRKGLFEITKQAGTWKVSRASFVGDNVSLVLALRDGQTVLAALDHGHFGVKLHRSSDGGQTFEEVDTPTYPPKPEDVEDVDPFHGKPIPWAVQKIWELAEGHPDEPGTVWCGTIPGGLFVSRDGGSSWTMIRSLWDHPERKRWVGGGADLPGLHSVCVDPRDG
ncbi:MAG: exo-alpha-sialidase, partial [Deltaproteobacteria bacterium]|nr:exo-alpha-sialidase [Deltaproteobacteria bacterium]